MRSDDVVITTPSKSGTTWMQHIIGMLLFGTADLSVPISTLSPWLDMQIRTEAEVFATYEAQQHRRFIKTHTPLDGLPLRDDVDFITVIRHPLDIALSDRDHRANTDIKRAHELRLAATGELPTLPTERAAEPDNPTDYLEWFIDNDLEPTGSGPYGLADFCQQVGTYWEARDRPNVHLFHYADLWADRAGEMHRVADALRVEIADELWPDLVAAASLDSMRERADTSAPEADTGLWHEPTDFFRQGGQREWPQLLEADCVARFHKRLAELLGPASDWVLHGRAALG